MMVISPSKQLTVERLYYRTKDRLHDFFDDLWDRFRIHIIWGSTTSMEFFMLFATLLSGLWLVLPIDTFATRGGYEVMRDVAYGILTLFRAKAYIPPEAVWGVILIFNAALWAHAIARDKEQVRRAAAMLSILIWSFVAACFMLVDFRFLSSVVYPYYTVLCIWLYLRAWR